MRPRSRPTSGERGGVEQGEQQAADRLATEPGGEDAVDFARLGTEHPGVTAGEPAIEAGDGPAPIAKQVEGDDGGDDGEREDVEEGEAAADEAGEGAGHPAEHDSRLAGDEVAQLLVDVFAAEPLLQIVDDLAGPVADVDDVGRGAGDQQADLGDQQRVEQQREEQHGGDEADDHDPRSHGARQADAGEPGGGRVEEIGDAGGGDEGQQDRTEQIKREAGGGDEAGQQAEALPRRGRADDGRRRAGLGALEFIGRKRDVHIRRSGRASRRRRARHRRRRISAWWPRRARSEGSSARPHAGRSRAGAGRPR